MVVIEHHLDLLAEADWILELGPVGGPDGGELLYQGPLAGLLKQKQSPTAPFLRAKLKSQPLSTQPTPSNSTSNTRVALGGITPG